MSPEIFYREELEQPKNRRTGRMLAAVKAFVLLALMSVTAYGILREGLYRDDLWLPVSAGILGLLFITLFVRGYYQDLPRGGWVLVALLAALVAVKGLSMTWTISDTLTIRELLRSAMYLATFILALGSLSSGRQISPLMDIAILIVAAVAGYGLLQKISPIEYPVTSLDEVRIDSTISYVNTFATMLGMGIVLALARMTRLHSAVFRGIYAVLVLAFLVALLLTVSRGGIGSLGIGLVFLFVLTGDRLSLLANLLLLSAPVAWLFWKMQDLEGLWTRVPNEQKIADGMALRNYLIIALAVAFGLQFCYSLLANRYELVPSFRRKLGAVALAGVILAASAGAFVVVDHYGGVGKTYNALASNSAETESAPARLSSASIGFREDYWKVAWDEWKERPLTGTGAGTFQYTWLQNKPIATGVKQVHNLYLEQGTETGVFSFLALAGFTVLLVGYTARAAWRSGGRGDRRVLLSGLVAAVVVYLISSVIEWHWYIPPATLLFFFLAAIAVKLAARPEWTVSGSDVGLQEGKEVLDEG